MDNSDNSKLADLESEAAPQAARAAVYTNDFFRKSPNDERQYYSYYLANGLQVLLISDPDSKKSAASLDLNRGSGHNPPEHLGLAHYLEHMLFLGTEKYPEPDGFQEFIGANGGSYNAYTAYHNTNYFFDIKNEHFAAALDRFADFFIAPIFNPEFAERERNVVDSEFYTGLNDDGRRYYAVFQENLNPRHPLAKFSVGTKETLGGDAQQLITALRKFYADNYRAPLMKLVLYSNSDLAELKRLAEQYFTAIDGTVTEPLEITEPLIDGQELPALVKFAPIKEARYLDYYFPVASQTANYKAKPARYIAFWLNNDYAKGLEAKLKAKGWSNGVYAGLDISLDEGAIFNIHVALTPQGSEHVKEITAMVFAALEVVEQETKEVWRFNEIATARQNEFDFRQQGEPLGYVRSLSRRMQLLPADNWLSSILWEDYEQAQVDELFAGLTPQNMMMVWVDPKALDGVAELRTETYYQVPYSREKLSPEQLAEYLTTQSEPIALPPKNPFLSSDIKLITDAAANERLPQRLDNPQINGWYKFNDSFKSPRVSLRVSLEARARSLAAENDKDFYSKTLSQTHNAKAVIYNNLMADLLNDKLRQEGYQGALAGYGADVGAAHYGLNLNIGGYNEKFPAWLDQVLAVLNDHSFKPEDFNRILDNKRRSLRNQAKNRPTAIANEQFSDTMLLHRWEVEPLLAALEGLTLAEMEQWTAEFFGGAAGTNIMAFFYGNLRREEAEQLAQKLELWNPSPLESQAKRALFLDITDKGRFITRAPNQQGDSAVLLYYQAPDHSYAARTKTSLLAQLIQPQFFLKLRTEQELGYIVSAYYRRIHQRPGLFFVVQSNHMHSVNILGRMDQFIAEMDGFLQGLSEDEFTSYKEGLLNSLAKPPQNYGEERSFYLYQIAEGFYEFDDRSQAIAALEKLGKQDLIDFWQQLSRAANSLAVLSDQPGKYPDLEIGGGKLITDLLEFKQQAQQL